MRKPSQRRLSGGPEAKRTVYVLSGQGALGALMCLTLSCGCGRQAGHADDSPPAAAYNIVLVSIDTLRADHLGCYGYFRDTSPEIDAFARESIFFEQAYAPMATTLPSHASLLTAVHPREHGVLANVGDGGRPFVSTEKLRSFAQVAKANGYATVAFVSATPLKKPYCGLDVGFDLYDQPPRSERRAAATTSNVIAWLERTPQQPFFLMVHYYDPHNPYQPPPPYDRMYQSDAALERFLAQRQIPDSVEPGQCKGTKVTVTRDVTNLYDGEIRYTDAEIGRLFEKLRSLGQWERSVIVLTADHGEGLNQHDWPKHGRVWNEQLHVPLMIRFPKELAGGLPQRVPALVSLIDVLPTVLGRVTPAWAATFLAQASGVDVLAPGFVERPIVAQRSARECGGNEGPAYALTTPEWRFHYFKRGGHMLFDRRLDPHELTNVFGSAGAVAEQMLALERTLVGALKSRGKELTAGVAARVASLPPEIAREMEALGYTGESGTAAEEPNQPTSGPASQP